MRLIVSGGGTGGHIYPALALIKDLQEKEPGSSVLYVGADRGLENRIVPENGIKLKTLNVQGFKRSISLSNFKTVYLFIKAVGEAKKIIRDFKPDVVLGTGGYVSGAVVYAAAKMNIPTVIHEQNSAVGITNKFLSHYVDKIGVGFEAAKNQFPAKKVSVVGNPRAQEVAHIKSEFSWSEVGLRDNVPTVLIFGGSQGAPRINLATIDAIPQFAKRSYQVLFVTGAKRYDNVMERAKLTGITNVAVKPYIYNMPVILPKVSLIVSRAGATSLAEITSLGIPSILIPSPYVTNDHQTKNAESLVEVGAAKMIKEDNLSGETLFQAVDQLMIDPDKRVKMAVAARKNGFPQAADALLSLLHQVIDEH